MIAATVVTESKTSACLSRDKNAASPPALRRALKRRKAIEPIIGHAKHDGLMGRNYLLGRTGDAMNAILAAAGHNLRIILRKLRLFSLCCRRALLPDLCLTVPAISLA